MKTTLRTFVAIAGLMLAGCGQQQAPKEKYCGKEISAFEVMDLKKTGDRGYKFSDDDNKLAADMISTLNGLFKESPEIQIGFIMRDQDKIGLYVLTPDDQAIVEKVSCYLLNNDFDGRLPKTRSLLFYSKDKNALLAAIKNKE